VGLRFHISVWMIDTFKPESHLTNVVPKAYHLRGLYRTFFSYKT
jgi:hypothetical protein